MAITITIKIDDETLKSMFAEPKKEEKPKKTPVSMSPYAQYFDERSSAWTNNPETNKFFLLHQQNYANEKLKAKGFLVLNEVYDMLGLPRTRVGQITGWVYDEENPIGDNYVDFGIFERYNGDFVGDQNNVVLLDFNVDGNIMDYI